MKTDLDILNEVFDKHKDSFHGSFHSVLWQILVNKVHGTKVKIFTNELKNGEMVLGIVLANENGWIPSMAGFKTENWEEAREICEDLNYICFGLSEEMSLDILTSSMFAR